MEALSINQIKFIRSLSQKKYRQESGLFIVEGEKMVQEAIDSNFTVREVYEMDQIGEKCMGRITSLSSPSPVLAIVEQQQNSIEEYLPKLFKENSAPLCLALDGIKDPGNLGTIIRLADWFGIDALFLSPDSVELYNPKVVQATMGAIFRKKIFYHPLDEVVSYFTAENLSIYGTSLDGVDIYREDIDTKGLIVMGSESFGISESIMKLINKRLFIPSFSSGAESLNVGVATAIVCSEFRRR